VTAEPPARPWLAPLTPAYRLALALRELSLRLGMRPVRRLGRPVISIGNLSTGGAGKTPLTIALAQALTRRGVVVDVLSRGYGRAGRDAMRVDPDGTAEQFGDEPLEIARAAGVPVFVAAQRYEAGLLAETAQVGKPAAGVHLLDDGFQHRQLHRDVDIVLLNRGDWQGRLLPAGDLREPRKAIRRASCLVIPAEDRQLEVEIRESGWRGPIWRVRRRMELPRIDGPAVAFCGIARPEQFFAGLEAGGMNLAARIVFADHYRYAAHDIERLIGIARKTGAAACMTTEKDRVRLGELTKRFSGAPPVTTAALRVEIEDHDAALAWLMDRIGPLSNSSSR
jgi:tetraacyldisaccharide 4'-kinase